MSAAGVFAGKSTFASSGVSKKLYMSFEIFKISGSRDLLLPAMNQPLVSANSYVTLYANANLANSFHCQMANGNWIAFDNSTGLNWLTLSPDPAAAIAITFQPSGQTLTWKTDVGQGLQQIYYSIEEFAPILTLNPSSSAGTAFSPAVVTPSLAELKQKGGRNANLTGVDLTGADLSGIDFTAANLSDASVDAANCKGTDFSDTKCRSIVWGSATADDAVLDKADFSKANLTAAAWGTPASAKGIVMTDCQAGGSVLGSAGESLEMTGANLSQGQFEGADLRRVELSNAQLGSGNFERCIFDGANLNGADLTRGFFLRASFKGGALLNGVKAQAANFIAADLTGADLTRAQLGSRAFLFYLAKNFAQSLDNNKFPQPALIEAFAGKGITLNASAPVVVITKAEVWRIEDNASGPFALNVNDQGSISVYRDTSLPAATLSGANCAGAIASSANLVGADLSKVRWNGSGSTLDHAELTGASFIGALLVGLDLTQANLSGADFSDAILCQSRLQNTLIGSSGAANPTRFGSAQLQGGDFRAATILSAGFFRAGVALELGVPLFTLPLSAQSDLTQQNLSKLADRFARAGFPFGEGARVVKLETWSIDNALDPNSSSPRTYRVELYSGKYQVFDGGDGKYLFDLNPSFGPQLQKSEASAQLVSGFSAAGYSLVTGAPISAGTQWSITAGPEAVFAGPSNYGYFNITPGPEALTVFGATLLRLRDWDDYPGGVAFAGTTAFTTALAPDVIGPAGYPYSFVTSERMSLVEFLTPPPLLS